MREIRFSALLLGPVFQAGQRDVRLTTNLPQPDIGNAMRAREGAHGFRVRCVTICGS